MERRTAGLVPLTGLAVLVVAIVGFAIGGSPPDVTKDSAATISAFYADNNTQQAISAMLEGLAAVLLVFFACYVQRALRRVEGDRGVLSTAAFSGLLIIALGLAIDATLTVALLSNADDLEPAGVQTLMSLYNNDFVPFAVGAEVFLLSIGLSVLTHRWLPRWLGVVLLAIAVLGVTPIGFVTFLASGLLIGSLGVLFALRERRTGEPTPAYPVEAGSGRHEQSRTDVNS